NGIQPTWRRTCQTAPATSKHNTTTLSTVRTRPVTDMAPPPVAGQGSLKAISSEGVGPVRLMSSRVYSTRPGSGHLFQVRIKIVKRGSVATMGTT
ncbi:MAG: hypothetical protein P8186_30765, partial [Anaerolineae bacterium]